MKLSCAINVYINDRPRYVKEAIESILNQSKIPDELIIVVDGPIGVQLRNLINSYEVDCEFIKVFSLAKNIGIGAARNYAINRCTGDLIAIMDADDISRPNRFELQYNFFMNCDVDYLGGQIEEFNELLKIRQKRLVPIHHEQIVKFAKYRAPMNNVTSMFKKSKYSESGGYDAVRFMEDYRLFYKFLNTGSKFHNLEDTLVDVRNNSERINRYRGINYLKNEYNFFLELFLLRNINFFQFFINMAIRLIVRVLPYILLARIYKILRR